jgi:predicted AlkP superfamily phosphohydrolase/phosphomutase
LSGFQVSGFTAPGFNPSIASPDRAFEVLREAGQGYAPFAPPAREEAPAERQLRDRIDLVPIVSRRLLSAMPCDVFMANFQVVDWVQHSAIASEMRPGDPTSLDPDGLIARTYQLVDERIGVMLGELTSPSTHIIVISDHGAAVVDRVVNLEKLFLDNGLMAYTSASTGKGRSLRWGRLRARIALSVWQALKRHAPGLAARLRPTGLKVRDRLAAYESDVRVDWSRTAAAPWGLYGQVRFNVRGRDPQGAVTPDQLPQLRRQIRALVLGLKDPVTGLPIYDEVREAEDVYSGPFVCDGPDLILVPSDSRYLTVCGRMFRESSVPFLDAQREVVVPLDPPRDFHSAQGIFGMAGPDVEPGRRLSPMDLVDFVPTALHLLNEPIPTDMDGHPVLEALSVERRRRQPVRLGDPWPPPETTPAEAAYTAEEQRELEKQLVSLGYI